MNIFICLFYFLPFLRFSYTDLRWQKVNNNEIIAAWLIVSGIKVVVCPVQLIALNFLRSICVLGILMLIVIISESIRDKYLFGGGDIKLISLLTWTFDSRTVLFSICLGCIFAIIFLLINKFLLILKPLLSHSFLF